MASGKVKLTVNLKVPINESVAIERIRKYFAQANYQELFDELPVLKFQRFEKVDKTPVYFVKLFFLEELANDDPNNRYSLVRLNIEPFSDYVSIKATFEDMTGLGGVFFVEEILQTEIESLKKALSENVFEPVKIENIRRRYMYSVLKTILLFLTPCVLFLVFLMILGSIFDTAFKTSDLAFTVMLIIAGALSAGLTILYYWMHRKRIERKINSPID